MDVLQLILSHLRVWFLSRAHLALENLSLRQQLAVAHRSVKRPQLRWRDRVFWVWLSRIWSHWSSVLVIVKPETVVRWHGQGFKLYWRWKSRKQGRPTIDAEIRQLIRRLSKDNPLWGTPRIRAELRLLGYDVAKSTIDKYRIKPRKPPSQTWRTFLKNHVSDLASIDFFVMPTATFRLLFCFLVLRHDRRRVVHFNVTDAPTALWVSRQLTQAFPFDEAPRYLIRDRDGVYGLEVQRCFDRLGIDDVPIAPRSPWQNPFVERLIGTIRRECLNHVIVLNESHLMRILADFFAYYHKSRTHQALDCNAPVPREVEGPERGRIVALPQVGGLHHRYTRAA